MFHASVAYLPSSFAMVLLTCAWSAWIGEPPPASAARQQQQQPPQQQPVMVAVAAPTPDYASAIWCVAAAFYLGWPFIVVAAAPLALDAIARFGLLRCISVGLQATAALVLPSAAIDTFMYGRPVLAFLNILLYNSSASAGSGAQLYGVEPWHYYLQNLGLNFNAALPAALLAPIVLSLTACLEPRQGVRAPPPRADKKDDDAAAADGGKGAKGAEGPDDGGEGGALPATRLLLLLSGLPLWLCFFSSVPHKEERFMFPVYTLLPLAAAISMHAVARGASSVLLRTRRSRRVARRALLGAMIATCGGVSCMRAYGQVRYYGAPLAIYGALHRSGLPPPSDAAATNAPPPPSLLCVGNEWYRYPSSFFLPASAQLGFIKDGFGGQLPALYSAPWPEGSRAVHRHFNGLNREEASRYVPRERCDALVDLLPIRGADDEAARKALQKGFEVRTTRPFLDAGRSAAWSRALYVPWLSAKRNAFAEYALLLRRP